MLNTKPVIGKPLTVEVVPTVTVPCVSYILRGIVASYARCVGTSLVVGITESDLAMVAEDFSSGAFAAWLMGKCIINMLLCLYQYFKYRNLDYMCKENGRCIVDVTRRNQCQSCRFKKCLAVNMKKEGEIL